MAARPKTWPFEGWLDTDVLKQEQKTATLGKIFEYVLDEMLVTFTREIWPREPFSDQIIVGITNDTRFGARCATTIQPTKYAVAIEGLVFPQIFIVLQRLSSVEGIFYEPAEIPQHTISNLGLPILLPDGPKLLFGGQLNTPDPCSEDNMSAANQITLYAITFIILHEFGHIVSGHFEHNLNKIRPGGIDVEEERALEHAADAWALLNGASLIRRKNAKDTNRQLELYGYALGIVFRILDHLSDLTNSETKLCLHPTATARKMFCSAITQSTTSKNDAGDSATLDNVLLGIEKSEEAWKKLGWANVEEKPWSPDSFSRPVELFNELSSRRPSDVFLAT